ncbi:AEC family transporter [Burkholderiaceae bacterium FT117]|uniref:AEC family transporter n=1 Tax=Zeimonas sediminis TaxID=2944268 RepID=UPI002343198D|nr:AEC family transporter [Zeimonas sediminis]MCM5570540.1 AEC family transporter [Zeimonas sediminis]
MNTITLLFPDLALIAIGQLLFRAGIWGRGFWQELEKMIYFLLFPALLFNTILRTNLGSAGALPALSVVMGAIAVGIFLGFLARPVLRPVPVQFASGVQCAFRFNSYILLALSQRFAGEPGLALAAIIMGAAVPILNVAAVWPLARNVGSGLARELARNPLILATIAGLAGNLAGLSLPEPISATIGRLGSASLALGLLAAGAGLRLERSPSSDAASRASAIKLAAWFTTVKLVAMPATALALSTAFGLPPLAQQIAVMYSTMPTAPAAYILASRMGGDGPFVAMLVTVSMLASLVAMPFWTGLVR